MPREGYYGCVNLNLLEMIPRDAKVVLEIGCGEGALCEAYRRTNPGVHWIGVESEEDAWTPAERNGVNLICGDVTNYEWWRLVPGGTSGPGVDCLVLGDIIEHLEDPWRTLFDLAYCCRKGAQVIASIPNIQHWSIVWALIYGHFDYNETGGLMDRTHLRWFTLKSVKELFEGAGLIVQSIGGTDHYNEGYADFLADTGLKPNDAYRAYQYLVKATKPLG